MFFMFQSRVVVLTVALLMLSAGCLGGGGSADGGAGDADDAGGDSGDSAGSSGDAGSGGVSAPEADGNDPAAVAELERTSAEAALRDAGSFTSTWTYSGTDADGNGGEVSYTYYADLDGNRAHVLFSTSAGDQETTTGWERFSTGEMTYARYGSSEGSFYQAQEDDLDVVGDAVSHAGIYSHGDVDDLSYEGTEQYDGVTVERYELSEAQSMFWAVGDAASTGSNSDVDITEFEYVVLIDDDGLSRYESWSYTGTTSDGQTVEGMWEYSLTDVGSTSFDDPEWLAEAEAQAQQPQG